MLVECTSRHRVQLVCKIKRTDVIGAVYCHNQRQIYCRIKSGFRGVRIKCQVFGSAIVRPLALIVCQELQRATVYKKWLQQVRKVQACINKAAVSVLVGIHRIELVIGIG